MPKAKIRRIQPEKIQYIGFFCPSLHTNLGDFRRVHRQSIYTSGVMGDKATHVGYLNQD